MSQDTHRIFAINIHITRRNLAELARERGDHQEAERLWRASLAECPADKDALRNLNAGGL
jgi:hypothetical protein